jgi:RimJ/RimL family protein N-acetyltransferase
MMSETCPVPAEPLRGGVVVLRPWEDDDAEWYVSVRDAEIFRWTTEPRELAPEEVRAALRHNRAQPGWVGMAITDAGSGALLGNIALRPTGERAGEGEVSYWLAPAGAFTRLVLKTMPDNEKSQAVALREGFVLDGADASWRRFALERGSAEPPAIGANGL